MRSTLGKQLVGDAVFTFAARMGNMVLAAVLGILTARVLGPHGRGIYAMPMVDAAFVSASFAGITSALSYYLLRLDAGRGAIRATLLAAGVFLGVGAVATTLIAYFAHATWSALPAVLSLPGPMGIAIASGYALGIKRVRATTSQAVLVTIVSIIVMALAFGLLGGNPHAAIVAWVLSTDLVGMALLVWVLRDARRLNTSVVPLRPYLWYSVRSGSVSLVSLLNYRADIYVVALMGTPAMLGMYTVAVTAAETLLRVTQVTQIVVSPHVASINEDAAVDLVTRSVRHNVIIAGVSSAGLALVAPLAVFVLYGASFEPMVPALRILLVGVFALSLGSPMSAYFSLRRGKPEVSFSLASLSAGICIALAVALVPRIGLNGAALASTVAYCIAQIGALAYFAQTTRTRMSALLLPRRTDLEAYARALSSLAHRRGPTAHSDGVVPS